MRRLLGTSLLKERSYRSWLGPTKVISLDFPGLTFHPLARRSSYMSSVAKMAPTMPSSLSTFRQSKEMRSIGLLEN